MTHQVAVYGTLRKTGLRSAFAGANDKPVEGSVYGYILKDTGHGFPAIFPNSDVHPNPVKVELITVDDETLDRLDSIEGVARGLYVRKHTDVFVKDTGLVKDVWIYEGGRMLDSDKGRMEVIESGDWVEHKRKHDYEMANR